jgi:hypothetical protein
VAGQGYNTERGLIGNFQAAVASGGGGGEFNAELYYIYSHGGGDAAISWIANKYGIHLPSGVYWKFEGRSALNDSVLGWNPISDGEILDTLSGQDNYVYIFAKAFQFFDMDPAGVVSILIHEARHAWVEYYREGAGYGANQFESQAAREIDASNTVLLAIDYGVAISSQGIAAQQAYAINQECMLCPDFLSNSPVSVPVFEIFGGPVINSKPLPHCQYLWSISDCW